MDPVNDPIFDPERRIVNSQRCDWCQLKHNPEVLVVYDKLHLHSKPILKQEKSCLDHYKTYCKFIKDKG